MRKINLSKTCYITDESSLYRSLSSFLEQSNAPLANQQYTDSQILLTLKIIISQFDQKRKIGGSEKIQSAQFCSVEYSEERSFDFSGLLDIHNNYFKDGYANGDVSTELLDLITTFIRVSSTFTNKQEALLREEISNRMNADGLKTKLKTS